MEQLRADCAIGLSIKGRAADHCSNNRCDTEEKVISPRAAYSLQLIYLAKRATLAIHSSPQHPTLTDLQGDNTMRPLRPYNCPE